MNKNFLFAFLGIMLLVKSLFAQNFIEISPFNKGLAIYMDENGNRGLIGIDGNFITSAKFSHLELLDKNESLYQGVQNILGKDRFVLLNKKGEQLGKMQYDYMEQIVDSDGNFQNLLRVKLGCFWGIVDTKGNKVTPLKYDSIVYDKQNEVGIFFEHITGVKGLIKSHEEILRCKDYYITSAFNNFGLAVVEAKNKKGVINTKGKVIVPVLYKDIRFFENGLIGVQSTTQKAVKCKYSANQKYLWGVYTQDGATFIKPKYSQLFRSYYLSDKLVSASICDDNKKTKNGYLNSSAKEIIPIKYDITFGIDDFVKLAVYDPPNPTVIGSDTPTKDIYLDKNMQELKIEDNYYKIHRVYKSNNEFFELEDKRGIWVFNKNGKMIVSAEKYSKIEYKDGFFYVRDRKSGRGGVLDKEGKVIVSAKYYYIKKPKAPFFIAAQRIGDGKEVVLDLLDLGGKPLGLTQFKELETINEEFTAIKDKNDLWGVIDKNGKIIITPRFIKKPLLFGNKLFIASIKNPIKNKVRKDQMIGPGDKVLGVVDANGREVVPFDKSYIAKMDKSTLIAHNFLYDKKFYLGYMFIKFKDDKVVFTSESYPSLEFLGDNLFSFCKPDAKFTKCSFGIINSKGEVVLEPKYELAATYLNDGMVKIFDKATNKSFVFNTKTKKTIMELEE